MIGSKDTSSAPKEVVAPAGAAKDLQAAWDAVCEARAKANSAQASKAGKNTLNLEKAFKDLKAKAEADGKKVSIDEKNQISLL